MNIKYDREMTLKGNNTVVTEMNKRIREESSVNGDPYKLAISWEEFFMGIAILSKTRPGQDRIQGKAVKSKTQHTHKCYHVFLIHM